MNTWALDAVSLEPSEKVDDCKNWARLVIKRKAQGVPVPRIAVEYAQEALELLPDREPGEDDEPPENHGH